MSWDRLRGQKQLLPNPPFFYRKLPGGIAAVVHLTGSGRQLGTHLGRSIQSGRLLTLEGNRGLLWVILKYRPAEIHSEAHGNPGMALGDQCHIEMGLCEAPTKGGCTWVEMENC